MTTQKPYKTDVAVLILFFNRPKQLQDVFDEIKIARPSKLFLYQDGPRGEHDMAGIEACRKIVEDIDWDCEVHRLYQEKNYGCDPSEYMSQKWAFSHVDKCIVLEDDDVPSQSFFPFCKELLDKYENDERISMICGFNYDEVTKDMPYDYFFTTAFSISGWASWKRVIDSGDENYTFLDDQFNRHQLQELIKERRFQQDFIRFCEYHRSLGKAYYETILHATIFFNSGLSIVPRANLINNAGATGEGVHLSGSNDDLPRAIRRIFTMKRHELSFPLKHPRYVIENVEYKKRMFKIMAWGHPWIKIGRSFEELWLNLLHGNFRRIVSAIGNRLRIMTGRSRFD
ncbi:hypothetical protein HMPREF0663_10120 [Hoylesella oralis ATCC 33269]|uniref:Hemolysin activation protein n=1 Tax=Hoylesella oralis ATCC 33269 TaxID=873533 RepID=E7RLX0_9BACT|nr:MULTISPECIES: hypothetical protein [Prevotellaceae]EFZ37751.1 hypothetical protein HMPREF0663_10120 [Hoylesella oralis ATCC 33269]EPH16928.1 hypothetical protein HMPREF1475_01253 [Hoylesella oralis HGA0225]ETD18316.1 hypothetical protein HMPREF1199_01127 [Hoylesella oralis CC98A]SHF47009.1 hypothetical protein SAMN05444288_0724 [Hoylesella oralis]